VKDRAVKPSEIRSALIALGERGNRLAEENERLRALLADFCEEARLTVDPRGSLDRILCVASAALSAPDSKG
jgi:hypothetical protein